tara:strand:- start:194 stop:685 length:492 start_codon:yes stop_codon:yes gene_type:complete
MSEFDYKKYLKEGKLIKENSFNDFEKNQPARLNKFIEELNELADEYHAELYLNDEFYEILGMMVKTVSDMGLNENKDPQSLLSFIKANQEEVAEKTMNIEYFPFEDIEVDGLGDVSIILKNEDGGMSFKYPEDVDSEFVGENNEQPQPITINGVDLMYIEYNI